METQILGIPVLEKSKGTPSQKIETSSSCCKPTQPSTACCTPSKTKEENGGECCVQPEDGTSCCNK